MPIDYAAQERAKARRVHKLISLYTAATLLLLLVMVAGYPVYNVWSRELRGKAALKEAQWDRQVAVEEAQARLESAKLDRDAGTERTVALVRKGRERRLRKLSSGGGAK